MCLINKDNYELNNQNRTYHNNDLSFPCSKKHNNMYKVNLSLGVTVYIVDEEEYVGINLVNERSILYIFNFVK